MTCFSPIHEQLNYTSIISRHNITNHSRRNLFVIHDILLPCFFILIFFQHMKIPRKIHCIFGYIIVYNISLLLFISGGLLSFYTNNSKKILFQAYGLSFLVYNLELSTQTIKNVTYKKMIQYTHLPISVLQTYVILTLLNDEQYYDFVSILWFLPLLHLQSYCKKDDTNYHYNSAISFTYICVLGTCYSFTNDTYWLRTIPLNKYVKYTVNQIPLLFLVTKLRR